MNDDDRSASGPHEEAAAPLERLIADVEHDASRPQPRPVDLSEVDTAHPDAESLEHRIGAAVAETALGVTGVHRLGGVAARTLDRASRRVLGVSTQPGVTVTVEDGRATVDLDVIVEYPHPVTDVMESVRSQVGRAVAPFVTGPVEVDIRVTDVHGPFDPPTDPESSAPADAEPVPV